MSAGTEKKRFKVVRARKGAGLGLVTREPIQKGKFVIEYTGPILSSKAADAKGGKYLFDINSKWTIDGSVRGNVARYINHSCKPNCESRVMGKRVKIYSLKNIKAGEEITYDYGDEYFDEFIKPHGCKCDACTEVKSRKE